MYHYSVKVMKVHKNDGYGGKKLEDLWHLSWCPTRNPVTMSYELQNSASSKSYHMLHTHTYPSLINLKSYSATIYQNCWAWKNRGDLIIWFQSCEDGLQHLVCHKYDANTRNYFAVLRQDSSIQASKTFRADNMSKRSEKSCVVDSSPPTCTFQLHAASHKVQRECNWKT